MKASPIFHPSCLSAMSAGLTLHFHLRDELFVTTILGRWRAHVAIRVTRGGAIVSTGSRRCGSSATVPSAASKRARACDVALEEMAEVMAVLVEDGLLVPCS
jgi:hypothetical protein